MCWRNQSLRDSATYRHVVLALESIDFGRVGLAVFARVTRLVGLVDDIEVIVANLIACDHVGDKLEHRGLANTRLANDEDSIFRCADVLRFDDTLSERRDIATRRDERANHQGAVRNLLVASESELSVSESSSLSVDGTALSRHQTVYDTTDRRKPTAQQQALGTR